MDQVNTGDYLDQDKSGESKMLLVAETGLQNDGQLVYVLLKMRLYVEEFFKGIIAFGSVALIR